MKQIKQTQYNYKVHVMTAEGEATFNVTCTVNDLDERVKAILDDNTTLLEQPRRVS